MFDYSRLPVLTRGEYEISVLKDRNFFERCKQVEVAFFEHLRSDVSLIDLFDYYTDLSEDARLHIAADVLASYDVLAKYVVEDFNKLSSDLLDKTLAIFSHHLLKILAQIRLVCQKELQENAILRSDLLRYSQYAGNLALELDLESFFDFYDFSALVEDLDGEVSDLFIRFRNNVSKFFDFYAMQNEKYLEIIDNVEDKESFKNALINQITYVLYYVFDFANTENQGQEEFVKKSFKLLFKYLLDFLVGEYSDLHFEAYSKQRISAIKEGVLSAISLKLVDLDERPLKILNLDKSYFNLFDYFSKLSVEDLENFSVLRLLLPKVEGGEDVYKQAWFLAIFKNPDWTMAMYGGGVVDIFIQGWDHTEVLAYIHANMKTALDYFPGIKFVHVPVFLNEFVEIFDRAISSDSVVKNVILPYMINDLRGATKAALNFKGSFIYANSKMIGFDEESALDILYLYEERKNAGQGVYIDLEMDDLLDSEIDTLEADMEFGNFDFSREEVTGEYKRETLLERLDFLNRLPIDSDMSNGEANDGEEDTLEFEVPADLLPGEKPTKEFVLESIDGGEEERDTLEFTDLKGKILKEDLASNDDKPLESGEMVLSEDYQNFVDALRFLGDKDLAKTMFNNIEEGLFIEALGDAEGDMLKQRSVLKHLALGDQSVKVLKSFDQFLSYQLSEKDLKNAQEYFFNRNNILAEKPGIFGRGNGEVTVRRTLIPVEDILGDEDL